jgi:hypothetical protein
MEVVSASSTVMLTRAFERLAARTREIEVVRMGESSNYQTFLE